MTKFNEGSRQWQDRFDTRRLADRIDDRLVSDRIDEDDRAFIEQRDMFFLATADREGQPQCSYKGGDPGFVRVVDEQTIAFPSYDGNGMFLSLGNVEVNPRVGLLFVDFDGRRRLRLNGLAKVSSEDALLSSYPGAQAIVRVAIIEIFPNCPRYIHRLVHADASPFVPREGCETPVPEWKRRSWSRDVLAADDPARDAEPLDRT
jgi:predicted pyridoxine 5'-phosphate oxidase superfamily flavin-nucleotide-binding protein